ncbi:MAG: hypothetical protein DMG41_28675 [Acidobacteria bacterium]|nr:MAG: hypothetical protein DMG42_12515 [Acidobacteriota bacterium]PYT84117.1 MAG: hypothetical protein DMG41_28675 [Acidobacteriota bacterium]
MLSPGKGKIGRNDPCPCGSGKKYKRCCLEQQCATHSFWARQRDASDQLTRDMLRFAERKFWRPDSGGLGRLQDDRSAGSLGCLPR